MIAIVERMRVESSARKKIKKADNTKAWLYSMPALVLIVAIIVFPILYTAYISFTDMSLFHWDNYKVIGFDNYARALFKVDAGFLQAIATTILWTVCNMVIQVAIAFLLALGLNAPGLKLNRVYKTLLMFPWAMPSYVSILLWRVGIYNTEFGLFNQILSQMGLKKVNYLSQNVPAFISCMILNLWMALPFMIMMFDGALQSIDRSYYESAKMDGAGFWIRTIKITIPEVYPIMAPSVILTTFTTFKQFDIIYLLTQQKGSLTGATLQTVITYAHQNAFVSNNYGLSSAVSMVIFVLVIVISLFVNRGLKEETNE